MCRRPGLVLVQASALAGLVHWLSHWLAAGRWVGGWLQAVCVGGRRVVPVAHSLAVGCCCLLGARCKCLRVSGELSSSRLSKLASSS